MSTRKLPPYALDETSIPSEPTTLPEWLCLLEVPDECGCPFKAIPCRCAEYQRTRDCRHPPRYPAPCEHTLAANRDLSLADRAALLHDLCQKYLDERAAPPPCNEAFLIRYINSLWQRLTASVAPEEFPYIRDPELPALTKCVEARVALYEIRERHACELWHKGDLHTDEAAVENEGDDTSVLAPHGANGRCTKAQVVVAGKAGVA